MNATHGPYPEKKDSQTVIAWNELTRRIDDESLFARIATLFLQDSGQRLESLSHAIADSDWESVCFLAHAIKGSAANISAHRLTRTARELENAARSQPGDLCAGLYQSLREEYLRVCSVLSDPAWHDRYRRHRQPPLSH
jgi:HPt (histidine-containing phosphotransfer) domain-containing protein